jgi:hypothetical protein
MIKELIKLCNHFDKLGLIKEADYLDSVIKNSSYQDRMIEERNYLNDPRTRAGQGKWYDDFDEKNMQFTYSYTNYDDEDEETEATVQFPAVYQVCSLCDGRGNVVNPSIDAGGISSEDFYDDPEFAEDYQSGVYDITCPQCSGKRVEPIVDESRLNDEQKAAMEHMEEAAREEEYDRRTRMAESGYGW